MSAVHSIEVSVNKNNGTRPTNDNNRVEVEDDEGKKSVEVHPGRAQLAHRRDSINAGE